MARAPFIVKPLKVLKSSSGLKKELFHSQIIHAQNIPLLISSRVLRSRNLGQVDIASINSKKEIEIFEVKSSEQGAHLSTFQYRRLHGSLLFLTLIFKMSGRLRVLK